MRKLSLFSGIGGIDLAAKWTGIETVAFVKKNLSHNKYYASIGLTFLYMTMYVHSHGRF